ncbi:MAG: hypothetical protein HUK22_08935, partial [Thermoguttaceae bacterium]|nr:hypothetical protein [Thermoguttaceae bacterium]
ENVALKKAIPDWDDRAFALYILSDYSRKNFLPGDMERIAALVREKGAGLLMLGGWSSYFGRLGEYQGTPIADVLPVVMGNSDDRGNDWSPVLLRPTTLDHPILAGLPWETAPGVGGFNRFAAKSGATTLIEGVRTRTTWKNLVADGLNADDVQIEFLEKLPFLVVDSCGAGRVAAFASDVAPHWIGGMVDWGKERVFQELPERLGDGISVEIGADYARFFINLLKWTANF